MIYNPQVRPCLLASSPRIRRTVSCPGTLGNRRICASLVANVLHPNSLLSRLSYAALTFLSTVAEIAGILSSVVFRPLALGFPGWVFCFVRCSLRASLVPPRGLRLV